MVDVGLYWDSRIGPLLKVKYKSKNLYLSLCHRREDRSIAFFGFQSPLCARCMGLCMGFVLALVLVYFKVTLPPTIALLLLFPLIVDGLSQNMGYRESNNSLRIVTGILFSSGIISLWTVL